MQCDDENGKIIQSIRYLCCTVKEGVADSGVVDFKLIDSVHVGNLKFGSENAIGAALQRSAHEGIYPDKLELNVIGIERHPLVLLQFLNFDIIDLEREYGGKLSVL